MDNRFSRTELLFGQKAIDKLKASCVAVFGIGGVGGYALEALARSGIGRLDITDHDKICASNINRQIYALSETIGEYKVDVAKSRIHAINPDALVNTRKIFYLPETSGRIDLSVYDYIIDAIDTVSGKIELIVQADKCGTPIISSMGAGNKMNITDFKVTDIYKTSVCPLAKVLRRELRNRGINKLKVVYSQEPPIAPQIISGQLDTCTCNTSGHKQIPGSNAFVPAAVGLIIAGEVIKDLIKNI